MLKIDIVLAEDRRTVVSYVYYGRDNLIAVEQLGMLPDNADEAKFDPAPWKRRALAIWGENP